MEPTTALADATTTTARAADTSALREVRLRRSEMHDSIRALCQAADASDSDPERWRDRLHQAVLRVVGDFAVHLEVTEEPGGLHAEVIAADPRLTHAVNALTAEHAAIGRQLAQLMGQTAPPTPVARADRSRELTSTVVEALLRHRERGAALVFEAYQTDLGDGG